MNPAVLMKLMSAKAQFEQSNFLFKDRVFTSDRGRNYFGADCNTSGRRTGHNKFESKRFRSGFDGKSEGSYEK